MPEVERNEDVSIWLLDADCDRTLLVAVDELAGHSEFLECYFERSERSETFVLLVRNEPTGFIILEPQTHDYTVPIGDVRNIPEYLEPERNGEILSVKCIWLKPDVRRQGLGNQLCLAALSIAGIQPAEAGWAKPVTEDGEAFLRSLEIDPVKLT